MRRKLLDTLPVCVYFDNPEIIVQNMNELNAEAAGFDSAKSSIGKTLFEVFTSKTAQKIIDNDQAMIKSKQIQIIEEEANRKDDIDYLALSIRFPWYDNNNFIVGLFGFSIMLGKQPLAESLALIAKLGLLSGSSNNYPWFLPGIQIKDKYLSKREKEYLQFYAQDKSAKEIARILQLSPRTIENYIQNIKIKLNTHNKADL